MGGALSFDTMAEQVVISLKNTFSKIKFIFVLLCKSQASGWSAEDKRAYQEIISKEAKVVYAFQKYFRGYMQKWNRHLVDYSGVCVCYLTKNTGGPIYTVRYAIYKGFRIENVAEKTGAKRTWSKFWFRKVCHLTKPNFYFFIYNKHT